MRLTQQHSSVVEEYLKKEVSMSRVIGPLSDKPSGVQINSVGGNAYISNMLCNNYYFCGNKVL